jgi:regulator of protease activity HflC (stomatin/prohibitin superfamily)
MQDSVGQFGVVIHEVQIRNVEPPSQIDAAIEAKQAAAERIEQKRNELEIERLEAERKVVEAEGIRDAQAVIDETLTEEYLRYLWIQEGLEKGDVVYVVPSDGAGQPVLTREIDQSDENDNR